MHQYYCLQHKQLSLYYCLQHKQLSLLDTWAQMDRHTSHIFELSVVVDIEMK